MAKGDPVVQLDDHRPQVVVHCYSGHEHVFPRLWLERWSEGATNVRRPPLCLMRALLRILLQRG